MKKIGTWQLLLHVFVPTSIFSLCYLILGHFFRIPPILLFCILGTFILAPIELGIILFASKKEYGKYSLKSAFVNQEKMAVWRILLISFLFFCLVGLLSVSVAPLENQLFSGIRSNLFHHLPLGFDLSNIEYLKSFPKSILIVTCIYYSIFDGLIGPLTEELFFRGYLTSHYEKQNSFAPILIAILFSLYHFWNPFENLFRILSWVPVAYVVYKKKNIYIAICFHCICNLFSAVGFTLTVLS